MMIINLRVIILRDNGFSKIYSDLKCFDKSKQIVYDIKNE